MAVVDEHRAATDLRVERIGDAAYVAAVAQRQQWKQRDGGVLAGVQRAEEVLAGTAQGLLEMAGRLPPQADGLELDRRQLEPRLIAGLLPVNPLALEPHHPLRDLEPPQQRGQRPP